MSVTISALLRVSTEGLPRREHAAHQFRCCGGRVVHRDDPHTYRLKRGGVAEQLQLRLVLLLEDRSRSHG